MFKATLPSCVFTRRWLLFHHTAVIFIPSNVSLSKTVIQSLSRSLSLSICQSTVSHSLIQLVPRLLSLSASRSFSHSIPLSLFAHLTSPSLTHLHSSPPFPSITLHVLVATFFTVSFWSVSLSLYRCKLLLSESHLGFSCFCGTSHELPVPQTSSSLFCCSLSSSNSFTSCHSSLLLLCFMPPSTLLWLLLSPFCLSQWLCPPPFSPLVLAQNISQFNIELRTIVCDLCVYEARK